MSTAHREQLAAVTWATVIALAVVGWLTLPITAYFLGRWTA